jgi:restriction endonuclease Mrr
MPAGRRANPMPKDQAPYRISEFTDAERKSQRSSRVAAQYLNSPDRDRLATSGPRNMLSRVLRDSIDEETAKEIATAILERAKEGDPRFIEFLFNRLEGRAIDRVETGKPGDHAAILDGITEEAARNIIEAADRFKAQKAAGE